MDKKIIGFICPLSRQTGTPRHEALKPTRKEGKT